MPLGASTGEFFTPQHGRYAARLISIRDGKPQTYPPQDGKPARTAIPAIWSFELYLADGTPVVDPKKPGTVAVAEAMSSQTLGYGQDGRPAKAREWITPILAGKGIVFPDDSSETDSPEKAAPYVAAALGAWAWVTFGENPVRTAKTRTVIRNIEPMIPQPAAASPAAPPVVAEPVAVPTTTMAPVAVGIAPTPVPTAPAFTPSDTTSAPAIPAMPFGQTVGVTG